MHEMTGQLHQRLQATPSLPFLFVGSGFSRRYLEAPNWEGLLRKFATMANGSDFAFEIYNNRIPNDTPEENKLPTAASLIEKDFNEKWYSAPEWATNRQIYGNLVRNGTNPFKLEIANYFGSIKLQEDHPLEAELKVLNEISTHSIAGLITTNYDGLLESLFDGFKPYIGQDELLFSQSYGVGEIYKIHGCWSDPRSIVLTQEDYQNFEKKNAYLAAKLMTYFAEHPIIFIGYSVSDVNIQKILKALVDGLSAEQAKTLSDRLYFVEFAPSPQEITMGTHTMTFGEKVINMTKIVAHDYTPIYDAINMVRGKYPTKILRRLKDDIYQLVKSNDPENKLYVRDMDGLGDDERFEFAVGVGVISDLGKIGYELLDVRELYRDVVFDNANFDHNELVNRTIAKLLKTCNKSVPFYKYIQGRNIDLLDEKIKSVHSPRFDHFNLLSRTIFRDREIRVGDSIDDILQISAYPKFYYQLALLEEDQFDILKLERFLQAQLTERPELLTIAGTIGTNFKRLIRIYDWLKYH